MKIFDPKLTGSIEILNEITGDVTMSANLLVEGNLSGNITGSASTASYIELSNVDGSASLASRIFFNSSSIASLETVSGSYANSASFASNISANSASIASLETISGSYANSASFASSISANSSSIGSLNAVSSSYLLNTTDTLTGDLTVTGNIIATTLNVQDVTASVIYSSGSNVFGSSSIDTQQFTGSILTSGNIEVNGNKFTVAASSGNTVVGGTLNSGAITSTGVGTFAGNVTTTAGRLQLGAVALPSAGVAAITNRSSDNSLYIQTSSGNTAYLLDGSQNTMYSAASTAHNFYISNVPKLTIDSSGNATFAGNVGVGMTPDTSWGTNSHIINLGIANADAGHIGWREQSGADELSVGWNVYHNNTNWYYASNNPANLYTQHNGTHKFQVAASGTADNVITWTDGLTINSSGNSTFAGDVATGNMTISGQEIDVSSGDFTLDVAGDISLDAGGNDIRFKVANVEIGKIKSDSGNLAIFSSIQDEDILFKGNDGGSVITALTLDMSNGGSATFRDDIDMGGSLNMTGSSKLIRLNGGGYIDFDSTNLQFNTQRNPNTGAFNDTNKSHAHIGLQGANGGSQIIFGTAAANNTVATTRMTIDSSGNSTFAGTVLIDNLSNYTGLEVKGSGASRPQVKFTNVNQGLLAQIYGTEGNALVITTGTSGAAALTLSSSQNATFAATVNALNLNITNSSQFNSTVTIEKIQQSNQFDTSSFLRLHPSAVTNSSGFTNMIFGTDTANNYGVAIGGLRAGTDGTPSFAIRMLNDSVIGTEVFRIDNNGSIGMGANSTSYRLRVKTDATVDNGIYLSAGTGSGNHSLYVENIDGSAEFFAVRGDGQIRNHASRTGDTLFGCTSLPSASSYGSAFKSDSKSRYTLMQSCDSTALSDLQEFFNPNGAVGKIQTNGSATIFNTGSDYRLKEDLQDFNGLDMVSKIPVYNFKWKIDGKRSYGVMAHELQEILPDAAAGDKDAINEDGSINPQGVDYSKIVPLLIKSIQEQQVMLKELKAEIEILKNK